MKRHLIITLTIILFTTGICSADNYVGGLPLTTVKQGEVSGGVFFDSYYGAVGQTGGQPITIDKTFALPSYTDIEWAMLLTTVYCGHMQNNYTGWANITFNGAVLGNESLNVPFTFKYYGGTGYETVNDHVNRVSSDYMMWYNVTGLIQAGDNTASVHTEKNGMTSFDGQIKLITLIVAYNDGSSNRIFYWVNRGHDVDTDNSESIVGEDYIGSTSFAASLPPGTTVQGANLTAVHMASVDGSYTFNSNSIASGTPQGSYSGYNLWDVTTSFDFSGTNTMTYNRSGTYYKIALGILTAELQPDLTVTALDAYHNLTLVRPYFNLSNEVDVTVENTGNGTAGPSKVSLYADDTFIGKIDVPALSAGSNTTVQFIWTPIGCDCEDGGSPVSYTLKAIADCDGEVTESNEENNVSTTSETAYWAGWSADENLNAVLHGTIQGGLYYTTGNGSYSSLITKDQSKDFRYDDIGTSIPSGAEIERARLNVYYTWSRNYSDPVGFYPYMEVSVTNTSGTYIVLSDAEYNDRPCQSPLVSWDIPFGNYVYEITDYVKGEGTITVTVKNVGPVNSAFAITAPGIVILYNDTTKPMYEYWLAEGADILEGGRRFGAGYLDLSECISNATFAGSVNTGSVESATLGIVTAWGGEIGSVHNSYYWFNNNYLGDMSILGGYSLFYNKTIDGITMYVGESGSAQVGVNVSDVTGSIADLDNTASFGDDGDAMMAANAFLLVEYGTQAGLCGDVDGQNGVTIGDGIQVAMSVIYGTEEYPLADPWAADVDCANGITIGDGIQIAMSVIYGTEEYPLECCS